MLMELHHIHRLPPSLRSEVDSMEPPLWNNIICISHEQCLDFPVSMAAMMSTNKNIAFFSNMVLVQICTSLIIMCFTLSAIHLKWG